MAFKDGDFLEIDYSIWNALDNTILDTTEEKVSKEKGIYDEHTKYGPALVVLGEGNVVKGVESALRTMDLNQTKKVTLKPEEAFGERKPDLMMVMPLAEFRKRDINPYPGMRINLDNMMVTVKSVNSGRVVVDGNHPYAGLEVVYDLKVVKDLATKPERITALGRTYGAEPSSVKADGTKVELAFGDAVSKNSNYFMGRANLIAAIFAYFKDASDVKVIEDYMRPKEKKEEKPDAKG